MGCGGSKNAKVAPADASVADEPPKQDIKSETTNHTGQQTPPSTPPHKNNAQEQEQQIQQGEDYNKSEESQELVHTPNNDVPLERPRTASIAFDVGMEKPKSARKPRRLQSDVAKGTPTKQEIAQKMELAEQRRLNTLGNKKAALASEEEKRRKARQALENKKNRAKEKMNTRLQSAEAKRDKELTARTAMAAQHDQKSKKARARRHEVAMQEAAKMDTGGEVEDNENKEANDDSTENEKDSEVQQW